MPAAIAMTFLMAPPNCTPDRSRLVYTRKRSLRSQSATVSAICGGSAATVSAVGSP